MGPGRRACFVKLIVIALVYIVAAKLGLSLAYATRQVTTVWPPTGIALAAMLLLGYEVWPAVLVGAFVANLLTSESAVVALAIAIGNTFEAVVGSLLLRHVAKIHLQLDRIRDVLSLVILAALLSPLVSATLGTISLGMGNLIQWHQFAAVWQVWWVGDAAGCLLFAPLILIWANPANRARARRQFLELAFLFALTFAASTLVFMTRIPQGLLAPWAYVAFPFIIWGALRLGQIGAVTATLIVMITAVSGTISGLGAFASVGAVEHNLILLQVFIFIVGLTSLVLAAAITERNRTQINLEEARQELVEANRRITDILADILHEDRPRRSKKD